MKIQNVLAGFSSLSSKILLTNSPDKIENNEEEELFHTIEQARQDLTVAERFFNDVTDPDLVDHAIFALEAAEKKYSYLLKQARKMGYKVDFKKLKNKGTGGW